jgi:WD40 repeat protein
MSSTEKVRRLQSLWQGESDEHLNKLCWSPNDELLAAAFADGSVGVFDTRDGRQLWRHGSHGLGTTALAWSPDGSLLASGGQQGGILLWNPAEGTVAHNLDSGRSWVELLCWSTDGQLASAAGRQIQLWNTDGELTHSFVQTTSTVTGLHWLSDGRLISSCYGVVNCWSPEHTEPAQSFPWKDSLLSLSVSPDNRFIAAGCQDNSIHLWYLNNGEDFQMSGYPSKVRHLSWSADGRYFATGGGQALIVWDCSGKGPQQKEPAVLPVHTKQVSAVLFSHAGSRVATGGEDGLIYLFDLEQGMPLAGLLDDAAVSAIAWSHDDRAIAIGYASGRIRICPVPASA